MKALTLIIILFFLIFVLKISFVTLIGICYFFITFFLTVATIFSLREHNIGSAIKTGIPAIIFILILFKAIF